MYFCGDEIVIGVVREVVKTNEQVLGSIQEVMRSNEGLQGCKWRCCCYLRYCSMLLLAEELLLVDVLEHDTEEDC
jgi:hypothetical protein